MNESEGKTSLNRDEVHLSEYIIILVRRSRLIIFTSGAVMVLTYLILLILPNTYTAKVRILPPQQNLTMSGQILDSLGGQNLFSRGSTGSFGGMAGNLLGLKNPSDLYVGILTGDTIFDRIIARFNLEKLYKVDYIEDARKKLGQNTKITDKNGIITIEVTSKTPDQSAQMANAYVEELDRLLQGLSLKEATGRMAFLEKERLQASENLQKAENNLRVFSEKNSLLQIDTQTKVILEYIARMRAEIDTKEISIKVFQQQATPSNFDMVRLETELKALKEKLRNAETQYDNCLSDVCLPANKTQGLALNYIRLYREVKFHEGLYQLYIKLVEIARLDMAREYAVIQVVDKAMPPQKRSNIRLVPSLVVGMATFFVMVLMSFWQERCRNMSPREEDVQLRAELRHIGETWRNQLKRIKNIILWKRKT
jgi:tyrosine-protein kinase Etk/Wzc